MHPYANRLGRRQLTDERDQAYGMSLALPVEPPALTHRVWVPGRVLDQGETPECVAYAWTGWELSSPVRDKPASIDTPDKLYAEAQALDGLPDSEGGTTVRAGAQVMRSEGRFANFLWAQTPHDLKAWLLQHGPVVVGTNWYESMFDPSEGVVHIDGPIAGGHAYLAIGFSAHLGAYRCLNSWGSEWGQHGRFWISAGDLHRLVFTENGEACAAVEQPISAKA